MAKLTDAGRCALNIVRHNAGINAVNFAVEFWGRAGLERIPQAETILEALVEAGYVSGSIRFRRHGKLYTMTMRGREALDGGA